MKHAKNNNKFEVNSKHKKQTTISTIMYYPHKKTRALHCNQILTIFISIPDKHAKHQQNGTFHKKHLTEHGKIIKKPENSGK